MPELRGEGIVEGDPLIVLMTELELRMCRNESHCLTRPRQVPQVWSYVQRGYMRIFSLRRFDLRFFLFLILLPAVLRADDARPTESTAVQDAPVSYSNLYVKVQLKSKIRVPALKSGDVVEGKLARSVYAGGRELLPAGSPVNLVVDKLERRRRAPNDHWPWVIKVFTPRHEMYPTFQSAQVLLASGGEVHLGVSLMSIGQEVEVQAKPRKGKSGRRPEASGSTESKLALPSASHNKLEEDSDTSASATMANFEAVILKGEEVFRTLQQPPPTLPAGTLTVAAGTQAKVILLGTVSASKSRAGDRFQARLVEPVYAGHTLVLPEGSIFEGKITKSTGPRMLSRSGCVRLSFTGVTSSSGNPQPIAASLTGVELDRRSHTRIDSEGQLRGDRPGKVWMLMNMGVAGGISKEADDAAQMLIEAIVSSATDVSTAGAARIAGACASGLFMLTRHGRDVVLPKFTEINIMFDRPAPLRATQPLPAAESTMPTQTGTWNMEQVSQ
ncbi:MAG: putative peptidoglycan binding domain protein [Acidobacteriaceae bacterium]|nr:putative peptidoglycan binding domain protein [Acidobacteriaceae bacterium]